MRIIYSKNFIKQFSKLPTELQEEVDEKIKLFKKDHKNQTFKIHKLQGKLSDFKSMSVNYNYRIIFKKTKEYYIFVEVGNHSLYR